MSSGLKKGSEIIVEVLQQEGVDVLFGFPGGQVIPLYDALYQCPIRHILTRHEQGAAHAADGYARATGRVGVCIATSGPGATNLVTGLTNAHMDSVPMVAITGQVPTSMIGNDSFQEADIYGISIPITKYNYLVKDINDLARTLREAFYIARTGRPGPVLVDIPRDIQDGRIKYKPVKEVSIPSYHPIIKGHPKQIDNAVKAIREAQRPVAYVGGGIISSGATEELAQLIRTANIPVTATLLGKGSFPEDDALNLGMPGMHGSRYANYSIYHSDLILALGVRFDDRVAGDVKKFAPQARIIHVDIDPAEIGKRVGVDIPIVGDVKTVLGQILGKIKAQERKPWLDQIAQWKKEHPLRYKNEGGLKPQFILECINKIKNQDLIITTDVGQHQMWAAQYIISKKPRTFISSGGLGTMGFGFPAGLGAQVGCPDKTVMIISGDGSFQMNIQELATARTYNIPVKICLFNNGVLGMVRQWQELFWNKRYSHTCFEFNPDFVKVAEGYDIKAKTVRTPEEVMPALDQALSIREPYLIDFRIAPEENVFPMVPAGKGICEILEES
ncbi:MAG TPA: biosynthetic-type acetolactate synthase large subunit [Thermodesulfobacteriota bacterium]|nr:biosynthetic-type acetolactate synthase large subunit [Thermodesulfobacteriota bacterium]